MEEWWEDVKKYWWVRTKEYIKYTWWFWLIFYGVLILVTRGGDN